MRRLILVFLLTGCGASAASEPSTSEEDSTESTSANEAAPSEAAPSEAAPSEAAPSEEAVAPEDRHLLATGTPAPDFSAHDQAGDAKTLAEHRGHPVVLYFYPRDATPGCTQEACAFRDAWERLQATGAVVYGVSTDDVAAHRTFADEHELPFSLLADPEEVILSAYGVASRSGYASRVTFLIDGGGTIRQVFANVDPAVHADEVIASIEALNGQ